MGTALREYLTTCPDIRLHAELEAGDSLAGFVAAAPEVVADLSLGHAVDQNAPAIVNAGIPLIIGATGYSPATLTQLQELASNRTTPVLIVPNFSLGANLLIKFAAAAARHMHAPSITERHHAGKADAPSGTARYTAQRILEAVGSEIAVDKSYSEALPGVMGAAVQGIRIHSLRGEGYLAEQEVHLGLPGETLVLEHRSIDRRCFMPGIVYAIRNIGRVRGLQIGLDMLLEI